MATDGETDPGPLRGLPRLLAVLSGAWTLKIVCILSHNGPTRFGVLHRRLGPVSTKTLTERLRSLEADGLVSRHYEPTVPPQVTYALTERMGELGPILMDLERLAAGWYGAAEADDPSAAVPEVADETHAPTAGRVVKSR